MAPRWSSWPWVYKARGWWTAGVERLSTNHRGKTRAIDSNSCRESFDRIIEISESLGRYVWQVSSFHCQSAQSIERSGQSQDPAIDDYLVQIPQIGLALSQSEHGRHISISDPTLSTSLSARNLHSSITWCVNHIYHLRGSAPPRCTPPDHWQDGKPDADSAAVHPL